MANAAEHPVGRSGGHEWAVFMATSGHFCWPPVGTNNWPLTGYVTNIPAAVMASSEVIGSYHELWHVEQSFRMSKTDLRARPMFHRTRDAIEAHLTIVFTALALSRTVQNRTGLAIANVVKQLRPLRSATIAINGTTQTFAPDIAADQQAILDAIQSPNFTH
ncbi:transposase [Arthrobacter sp. PAMC25284]|uniref:IS1634 family transposase n=1 Tax=Arthrobacter sp. PAMC25284 TaxID=2861279 RepID=UPI0035BF2274